MPFDPIHLSELYLLQESSLFFHVEMSDLAKDLIQSLLEKDPDKRFTAKETLAHPWFDDANLDSTQ